MKNYQAPEICIIPIASLDILCYSNEGTVEDGYDWLN